MSDKKKNMPEWLITSQNSCELMANAAHEIRYPLTIISGFSELLWMVDQGKTEFNNVDREKALRAINNASVYLIELVSSIVEFIKQQEPENQEISQLFANLSHDIRAPANEISRLSELLLTNEQSNTVWAQEALQAIRNSGKCISESLSDMFDIAKYGDNNSEE